MALNLLIWDKNADAGIVGQSVNQKIMGELMPSYLTREEQFIRPANNNPRGFILLGGTYISMTVKDADETPRNLVFGSPVDTEYKFVEQLLDDGVAFQPGKDYYVYLVLQEPAEAQPLYTADIKVSLNSTYPQGYTADTSRKIGGFHTLCANVGTIDGHPLSGLLAGDILPASFWDLSHRPTCQPEGMVYVKELDFWCDIYLQSGSGVNTKSVFGGTTTDSQTQSQHVEDLFRVGKMPLQDEEFQCAAEGSNQGTNIQNSADPVTTGGHVDTAGRRMVSNYGLEDCCGALWQWLAGWSYGSNQTAAYVSDGGKGQIYQVNALLAGGAWADGAICGSRARYAAHSRLNVYARIAGAGAGRGAAWNGRTGTRNTARKIRAVPLPRSGRNFLSFWAGMDFLTKPPWEYILLPRRRAASAGNTHRPARTPHLPKHRVDIWFSGPGCVSALPGPSLFHVPLAARTQQDNQEKGHRSGSSLDGDADSQHRPSPPHGAGFRAVRGGGVRVSSLPLAFNRNPRLFKNPFCAAGAFMLSAGGALLFQRLGALLAGGNWANSAICGSRARNATNSRLNVNANYGCQGQARIRGAKQLRLNDKAMSRKPWGKTHDGGAAGLVCKAERLAARCILMKRYGNLFPKIVDENNLMLAYTLAKKGKSKMYSVHRFDQYKEKNLAVIRQTLLDKTFTTSKYQEKIVYEPKKRTIYVLPFSPDRIVQHALMNVVIPIWSKFFIHDSYACIEGKGIHSGSRRTMEFVRRNAYCLKCDISKFYPSIDHDILMNIIRRKIKCKDTLWLIENIVYSYPGGKNVPIGNFTSQWMGNLYLNELDHYVKNVLKIKDYIRYCDDFLFFHNNKAVLRDVAARVEEFVGSVLKLRLSKCDLFPVGRGVDFLGYRHFRGYVLLRKRTAKRVAKRLKALPGLLAHGEITPEHCRAVLASATGWLKWANTYNFQRAVHLSELVELANGACRQQREAKAVALQ